MRSNARRGDVDARDGVRTIDREMMALPSSRSLRVHESAQSSSFAHRYANREATALFDKPNGLARKFTS